MVVAMSSDGVRQRMLGRGALGGAHTRSEPRLAAPGLSTGGAQFRDSAGNSVEARPAAGNSVEVPLATPSPRHLSGYQSTAPRSASEATRVAVRIRPFSSRERKLGLAQQAQGCYVAASTSTLIPLVPLNCATAHTAEALSSIAVLDGNREPQYFVIDQTFASVQLSCEDDDDDGAAGSQEDVYNELGAPMIRSGLAGVNCCLIAFGETGAGKSYTLVGTKSRPGVLPRLLQGLLAERTATLDGSANAAGGPGSELRLWLSALEIYGENVRDLLSANSGIEQPLLREGQDPSFVEHPTLGVQVVGAVEAPCLDVRDVRQLVDFVAKRRAIAMTSVHTSSSRSHVIFTVRLELRQGAGGATARLSFVDLAGAERLRRVPLDDPRFREGLAISRSLAALGVVIKELGDESSKRCNPGSGSFAAGKLVPFHISKLTLALKDPLCGNCRTTMLCAVGPAAESSQASMSTMLFGESVRKLRTCPRPQQCLRTETLTALQEDAFKLQRQLAGGMDNALLAKELADRQRLLEEMRRPHLHQADEHRRLAQERAKFLEGHGLKATSGIGDDDEDEHADAEVTPYLMNMSDDPMLAGCLFYYLRPGDGVKVGSALSNTIVMHGLGVLPFLCEILNNDNVRVSLRREDSARRCIHVNGQVMPADAFSIELNHRDRICFGHAITLRLHVPLQAEVATIDESQELVGWAVPPVDELVFTDRARELLPKIPDRADSFRQLQPFMEHSEAFSELQLYMEDLYSKLNGDRGVAFFRTLQEACALVDEANAITREVKPEDPVHFEVEFVWDIYRDTSDILMIRLLRYDESAERSEILHYWTYAKFCERVDLMRDVHSIFRHTGRWLLRDDPLEDPWTEPSVTDYQGSILAALLQERRRASAAAAWRGPATEADSSRTEAKTLPAPSRREESPTGGHQISSARSGSVGRTRPEESPTNSYQISSARSGSVGRTPRAPSVPRSRNNRDTAPTSARAKAAVDRRPWGSSPPKSKTPMRQSPGGILSGTKAYKDAGREADELAEKQEEIRLLQKQLQESNEQLQEKTAFIDQMRDKMQSMAFAWHTGSKSAGHSRTGSIGDAGELFNRLDDKLGQGDELGASEVPSPPVQPPEQREHFFSARAGHERADGEEESTLNLSVAGPAISSSRPKWALQSCDSSISMNGSMNVTLQSQEAPQPSAPSAQTNLATPLAPLAQESPSRLNQTEAIFSMSQEYTRGQFRSRHDVQVSQSTPALNRKVPDSAPVLFSHTAQASSGQSNGQRSVPSSGVHPSPSASPCSAASASPALYPRRIRGESPLMGRSMHGPPGAPGGSMHVPPGARTSWIKAPSSSPPSPPSPPMPGPLTIIKTVGRDPSPQMSPVQQMSPVPQGVAFVTSRTAPALTHSPRYPMSRMSR